MPEGPPYVTLAEALESGKLAVTEVSAGGHVPTLRAENSGDTSVLILDGEELAGAKQNRVLNTTVLLGAGKAFDLPVSCTEAGRWSYVSARFRDSGHISPPAIRGVTHESVTANVRVRQAYASDQGAVWGEGASLSDRHGVFSDTSAARDVYERRSREIRSLLGKAIAVEGQQGVLAVAGGEVVGLDVLSRPAAYARLHERIVRSYALDALWTLEGQADAAADARRAKEWLVSFADLEGTEHSSPGMGKNHRLSGPGAMGAALTYRGAIVHAAFFAVPDHG